jgi:methyl-accepting chemotaxis protein
VVRVVRTSTAEVDRRASVRHETNPTCRVTPSGGATVPIRVNDLSEGGARLADAPNMRDGQRRTLEIPGAGSALPFQVRRSEAGTLHVAFEPEAARTTGFRSLVEQLARRRAA